MCAGDPRDGLISTVSAKFHANSWLAPGHQHEFLPLALMRYVQLCAQSIRFAFRVSRLFDLRFFARETCAILFSLELLQLPQKWRDTQLSMHVKLLKCKRFLFFFFYLGMNYRQSAFHFQPLHACLYRL